MPLPDFRWPVTSDLYKHMLLLLLIPMTDLDGKTKASLDSQLSAYSFPRPTLLPQPQQGPCRRLRHHRQPADAEIVEDVALGIHRDVSRGPSSRLTISAG